MSQNTLRVNYLGSVLTALCVALSLLTCVVAQSPPLPSAFLSPLSIDFNPDNGRGDVLTRGMFNWPIGSVASTEQTLGGVKVELLAEGNANNRLAFDWWKGGYDFGATQASDGVTTTEPDAAIRLRITGLPPGRHTLTTMHNWVAATYLDSPIMVEVAGNNRRVVPSHRVQHDDNAATCQLSFEQVAGQSAQFLFRPTAPGQRVIINALALDIIDPALQVRCPLPADGDEHVAADPVLQWQPPVSAADRQIESYRVYFGNDREQVSSALPSSPLVIGQTQELRQAVVANDPLKDYFWRVDAVGVDGAVVQGKVQRFKIRALAFPTAEGYGRFASGGRGGRVIEVTNLEDAGPGSLRAAIDAEGPRTIIFRVGGTIQLKSKLIIRNPYVTIAGHTAPGDGICVRGYTFGCLGTHDCIMRYVRIRVGDEAGETMDGTGFASTDHAIYDHCSISWSIDEAVSSRGAKNITLQRCLVAEALNIANHRKYQAGKGHSFAASISGDIGSFHHNLLVHCAGRNWSLAGGLNRDAKFAGRIDIRNNVVYNWQHRTNDGGVKALNLVNNLYLPGPASKVFHLLKPDAGSPTDPQQYFVAGNDMPGHFTANEDNWLKAVQVAPEIVSQIKLVEPFCEPFVKTHETSELMDQVLGDVGANHSGLDRVDSRLIGEVRQRRTTYTGSRSQLPGIIDSQTDVGGWPELKSGPAYPDRDHDGMDDTWEQQHGLNPNKPDNNQPMPGGPTALEAFLHSIKS